mgnify:CR=1 FL=1
MNRIFKQLGWAALALAGAGSLGVVALQRGEPISAIWIVIAAVCVFGRDSEFLDAFDDPTGQVVLAIVALCFFGGVWWLVRLTRFDRPARFLSVGAAGPPGNGGAP